jgi:S1-C subfamily serine protease
MVKIGGRFVALLFGAGVVLSGVGGAEAALLPPMFVNCVVAIGSVQVDPALQPPRPTWRTEGTGFFYGYLVQGGADITKHQYETYLVTAKHVVLGHQGGDLHIRVNPTEAASAGEDFTVPTVPAQGQGTWFYHPDPAIDVAVVRVNISALRDRGFQSDFFANDVHVANVAKLKELDVAAGDGVFVLGFPMGMAGAQRNYVVVRQGAIARVGEMLDNASKSFLIDAFVFPGNSGGPVILKPEIVSITGMKSHNAAHLIGLVLSYTTYNDTAISAQTRQPRIIFQENSGLAEVLPTNYIEEAIEAWRQTTGSFNKTAP